MVDLIFKDRKEINNKFRSHLFSDEEKKKITRRVFEYALNNKKRLNKTYANPKLSDDELFTFIYHNNRAEAMVGYNDDLVMSFAIGLWVRDTALRLRAEGIALQKNVLNRMIDYEAVYTPSENKADGWQMDVGDKKEDLTWLIK